MRSFVSHTLLCLFALGVPLAGQASGQQVIPLPPCVRYNPSTSILDTYWGYAATAPLHLDVGQNNFFFPGLTFRNQPTDFQAGVHERVFVTSFLTTASTPQITWFVNGRFETASALSRPCDPPTGLGEWDPAVSYAENVVVSFNGLLWVSPYQSSITRPNLNVQPGTNVVFWRLFSLTRVVQGDPGLQGDPGPRGDPGGRGDPGPPGQSVIGAAEAPGSNCPHGGVRYTAIGTTRFVCNGAPGPQGSPGNSNLFTSAEVYTFPSTGRLTIFDENVTPTSLIVLMYVAGGVAPVLSQNPVLMSTAPGQFTATGVVNKPFRYAVIK